MKHRDRAGKTEEDFRRYLLRQEKSRATIEKYMTEAGRFTDYLKGKAPTKERLLSYREALAGQYRPGTVNGKLCAVHAYLSFLGRRGCRVKLLKIQREAFVAERRELGKEEYQRLLRAAKEKKDGRLYYLLLTLGNTGIRVSELKFITAEAVRRGQAHIRLKGKCRTVLLPPELTARLKGYMKQAGITAGSIFRTRSGQEMDRSNICHEMKRLCREARVERGKVFPHNLRRLFARCFYQAERNLALLADILGHSAIETTRIYVAGSARDHGQILKKLGLFL